MNELRVNVYKILNDCVEQGIEAGYIRAHKHTDTPSEELIKQEIERYIMLNISENFIFPEIN
jgi:hypothetical protein